MQQQHFIDAVLTGKLLQLIGRGAKDDEDATRLLQAIGAKVEASVATLLLRPGGVSESHIADYLDYTSSCLYDFFGQMDLSALVAGTAEVFRANRESILSILGYHVSGSYPDDDGEGVSAHLMPDTHGQYNEMIEAFRHIVLHDEWLSTLVALGADMASEESHRCLCTATRSMSTADGRKNVEGLISLFVKNGLVLQAEDVSAGDAMEVMVKLDASVLANMPRVRALSLDHHEVSPRICDLLAAASQPQVLTGDVSANSVAVERMAELERGLDRRAAAVEAARHRKSPDLESRKAAALATLRSMGEFAAVLREFPELLEQA